MASKAKLTKRMKDLGMAWATRSDKFVDPNDPMGERTPTYHVHPDASQPWQNAIKRFRTLNELTEYIDWREKVAEARKANDDALIEALLDIEPGTF